MLAKKNRVDRKLVTEIFKKGFSVRSGSVVLKYFQKKDLNSPRISFVCPKNVAQKATKRNYWRRQGYFYVQKYIKTIPQDLVGVFILKAEEKNLGQMIQNIIQKIK